MSLLYSLVDRGWKLDEILTLSMLELAVYQGIKLAHYELKAGDADG